MCWIILILTGRNTQMVSRPMENLKLWFFMVTLTRIPCPWVLNLFLTKHIDISIIIQIGDKVFHQLSQAVFFSHYALCQVFDRFHQFIHLFDESVILKRCICFIGVSKNFVFWYEVAFDFCLITCSERICCFHENNLANLLFNSVISHFLWTFAPLKLSCMSRLWNLRVLDHIVLLWMLRTCLWQLTKLITWLFSMTFVLFLDKFWLFYWYLVYSFILIYFTPFTYLWLL